MSSFAVLFSVMDDGSVPLAEHRTEDVRLAARSAGGDRDAQRQLVVRLLVVVRRVVRSLLGSDAEAEDAVQMSMIEVLRSAKRYRGEGALEGWAGRIGVRVALRAAKSRRGRPEQVDWDGDGGELAAAQASPSAEIEPHAIDALVASLSEERRTCLVLRHVHGYTVDEIAELTGASPNTVKDRLLHARAQLRERVRRDEEAPRALLGRRARRRAS